MAGRPHKLILVSRACFIEIYETMIEAGEHYSIPEGHKLGEETIDMCEIEVGTVEDLQ